MTCRERFRNVMHYQPIDRVPFWDAEGITEQAVRRWCREGFLPGYTVHDLVQFDPVEYCGLDTMPIPTFVPRVIEEDEEWQTTIDPYGFTVRTLKAQAVAPTIYYYVRGSMFSREDWERMKKRYDPRDLRRYPRSWSPELLDHWRTTSNPVGLRFEWGPGRSIKNGYMLGLEAFLEKLTDDPGFIHDIFEYWAEFIIELARPIVEAGVVDFVWISEDGMAYKNSTLISPRMYATFWAPYVKRVTDFLRANGIDVIGHYTSGNIAPLIPSFMEAGINLFGPLEVAADMDAVALKRQFGRDILLIGNISRQALMHGPDAVEREFAAKVPWLMEQGGYLPAIDDMVLPDISFESFMRYVELVREYTPS
jgi:uroporphyrinogen decarboxylase